MPDLNKLTTINVKEKSNIIWGVADILRDDYKPHEYGKVILPMCVLKRFDDVLAPTKDKVLEKNEEVKDLVVKDGFLQKASGYNFYNTSPFDFKKLTDNPTHIETNFRDYWNGFSENIKDILENYKFEEEVDHLVEEDLLYEVIDAFNKPEAYMGIDKVTAVDMGYIFEDLVKRFSESYGEDAGSHFTSRDIVYLMTDLLIAEDKETLKKEGVEKTVYDMAMGTSQMLTSMTERLKEIDPNAEVHTFGQERNRETYAIAKSSALIHGQNADNMRRGNTLSNDQFKGYKFDYCISNPPFGVSYKSARKAVQEEHELGSAGRFIPKLPAVSDGQLLFNLNGLSKLKDDGRMAIIHNSSALTSKGAGYGESETRKFLIENDYIECIIQLSESLFYNTPIKTYIWIVTKNKDNRRKGKIQLIDASEMRKQRRKSIGKKKYDITKKFREFIVEVYTNFESKTYYLDNQPCISKILDNDEFGYQSIEIEYPLYDEDGNIVTKGKRKKVKQPDKSKSYTEIIPLNEDIEEYYNKEIKPYSPECWVNTKKTKIGYEIPFSKYFYKFDQPKQPENIAEEIRLIENKIHETIKELF